MSCSVQPSPASPKTPAFTSCCLTFQFFLRGSEAQQSRPITAVFTHAGLCLFGDELECTCRNLRTWSSSDTRLNLKLLSSSCVAMRTCSYIKTFLLFRPACWAHSFGRIQRTTTGLCESTRLNWWLKFSSATARRTPIQRPAYPLHTTRKSQIQCVRY